MAPVTSALHVSDLTFYSDLFTTVNAEISASASTFTLYGVGASTATLTNLTDPVNARDAANKEYVDSLVYGLSWKEAVNTTTTVAITLGTVADASQLATTTIDGVTYTTSNTGTRILVTDQSGATPAIANGIYVLTLCTTNTFFYWARSLDMATGSDATGAAMYTAAGTANAGISFVQNQSPAIVGTNALYFVKFTSTSPAGGADTDVQYNKSGAFGGDGGFTYNYGTQVVSANGTTNSTSDTTGTVVVAGGLGVSLNSFLGGNVTMDGSTAVLALTNAGSSVAVSGTTDASSISTGSIHTAGGVGIAKQLWVGTNATLSGASSVLTLSGTSSSVVVDSTTDATSATTGSITTAGGVGIAKQLWVGTNATLSGASSVLTLSGTSSSIVVDSTTDATSTSTGSITTAGGVGVAKQLWVGTNTTMPGGTATLSLTTTNVNSTSVSTGSINTSGGLGVTLNTFMGGNLNVAGTAVNVTNASSVVTVSGTTDATSTSTGSIVTAGGVGIAKQLWVGTNATLSGTSSVLTLSGTSSTVVVSGTTNATSSTTGSVTTAGGLGVAQDTWVGGNAYATAFLATSDETLKCNIRPLEGALDMVNKMEGRQYEWINEEMGSELQTGLIAQQLESIGLGHVVDSRGSHKKVNYLALFPYLVEAIHELSSEVRELRAQRDM